ncbi:tryptophan 2,3-dioxygenase [Oceanobacillus oncorhynchi subsp. incaldanensis]|uniref:Tryptophan 2,3-dioxygenase n=1 Tax=Oceanobacillus aidingensis TaxID=645964 RepID=A0ABV9JXT4_9BACI|nr:tryptophan 2,3-dioxygenase [Oceanobacillus oncorhynchi]UUI41382.1 tryptophan 2,3-dioxygenase [Oceanobacillus oncorhynchi]GIO17428.1 tryptophan 2,3-dioxygenase [Oceanobacillus oncorhynchi subsp. incaldanensis]
MKSVNQHQAFENEKSIQTDFKEKMTYSDYLSLDTLLSSQHRLSGHHDEMLFIIVHHVSELWMKQILHEIHSAIDDIQADNLRSSFKKLARVSQIQEQLKSVWDVLSTLTPSEYIEFRDKLGSASGFQSYQNRLVEFALGYKTEYVLKIYENDTELHPILQEAYDAPSLYDVSIQALSRAGFSIDKEVLNRDARITHQTNESVKRAWMIVYKNVAQYWELYELAEKLVDIEGLFQQWRFRHMKTVERIIGFKKGTGGSGGVSYLKKVLDQYFFPELWDLRTEL